MMRMQTSCSAGARAGGAGRPRGRLARLILLGALSSTLLAWPDRAAAQDCGSWPRPVLCDARLRALSEDRREERLDEQSRLRLAPRGRLDLLVGGPPPRGARPARRGPRPAGTSVPGRSPVARLRGVRLPRPAEHRRPGPAGAAGD